MLLLMLGLLLEPTEEVERLKKEVERLGEQVEQLDRKVQATETKTFDIEKALNELLLEKKDTGREAGLMYDEGFWFVSKDDKLKFSVWAQEDFRVYDRGFPGDDTFLNRRARIAAAGTLEQDFNYQLMIAAERSSNIIQFAWVEYARFDWARLRVGQFKEPFSGEELLADLYMEVPERTVWTSNFAPAQDIGAMVHGKIGGDAFEYALGAFNGRGKNLEDTSDDKDLAGLVSVGPVKGLRLGTSATWGRQDDSFSGVSYRTAGGTRFFTWSPGVEFDDVRARWSLDIEYIVGPVMARAGWMRTDFHQLDLGAQEESASFKGGYLEASVILTGESKRRNRPIEPKRMIGLKEFGWGAWEVYARVEEFRGPSKVLDLGYATGVDDLRAWTAGVNWWLNRHLKVTAGFTHTEFDDSITIEGRTYRSEDVILFRVQFEM